MGLPKAVEDQEKRANEIQKEVYGNTGEKPPTPTPTPEEKAAAEKAEAEKKAAEEKATAEKPPATEAEKEHERLKQSYTVLQGKYDAEVPRLHAMVEALNEKIKAFETKPPEKPLETVKPALSEEVRAKMVKEYGEDYLKDHEDLITSVAQGVLAPLMEKFEKTVAPLQESITEIKKTNTKGVRATFESGLTDKVPEWEQLRDMPEFLKFLEQPDPLSGEPIGVKAKQADKANNLQVVVNIYNMFKESLGEKGKKIPDLKKILQPSTTHKPPKEKQEEPIITQTFIAQFYESVKKGAYRGKEAEAAAIEARINKATAEEKVVRI
jgi:hypothetical protein